MGSRTRRRPKGQDFAAAKDAEFRIWIVKFAIVEFGIKKQWATLGD